MYYLSKLPGIFILISARDQDKILKLILECTLSKNSLFSITRETDGTTSVLLRPQDEIQFDQIVKSPEIRMSSDRYHCFQLDTEDPGLNEAGMLAKVTTFLADHQIPILCLSTFNCNYIYYPIDYTEKMIEAIKSDPENYTLEKEITL